MKVTTSSSSGRQLDGDNGGEAVHGRGSDLQLDGVRHRAAAVLYHSVTSVRSHDAAGPSATI